MFGSPRDFMMDSSDCSTATRLWWMVALGCEPRSMRVLQTVLNTEYSTIKLPIFDGASYESTRGQTSRATGCSRTESEFFVR